MAEDGENPNGDAKSPVDSDDRQLLEAWSQGDLGSGDKLTRKYFKRMHVYFGRRVPKQDAEDLVVETFLELAKSKAKYRGDAPVKVFVYAIARNVMRQYFKKRERDPEHVTYSTSLGDPMHGNKRHSEKLVQREDVQNLRTSLKTIPLDDFDLLELRYWQGFTGPELSHIYGLKEGTIRSRIRKALERLSLQYHEASATPGRGLPDVDLEILMDSLRPERA